MLVEGVVIPVEMERKPLKKRLRVMYIPVILSILGITVCIVNSMLIYNKTFRFYTEQYYRIAQAFEQVSSFTSTLDLCQKLPSSTAYDNLADAYDIELLSACSDLFSTRFEFDSNERQEIESLYDIVRTSIPDKLNLLKDGINDSEKCEEVLAAVRADITTVADKLNHVIEKSVAAGNKAYDNDRIDVYLIEGLMIAIFIGFIIVTAYMVSFIEKRIIKPIRDVADWSKMFKDDYADMSDIEITDNDEISDIVAGVKDNKIVGYVITVTDSAGYAGDIKFSVGVGTDGTYKGTSILSISETAGLGMRAKTDPSFLSQFNNVKVDSFTLVKDGTGSSADDKIDAISGSTVTSKAVTSGINAALAEFNILKTTGAKTVGGAGIE